MKIRLANLEDVPSIKDCVDSCAGPLYYTADTTIEWLEDNLRDNGVCYIAENGKQVIGYCILIYRDRVWNTAANMGFAGINQMETMGVRDVWRKAGIAKQLMEACCEHINTNVTMATVHPDNMGSKKVLTYCGFKYNRSKDLYDGSPREIWFKKQE